MCVFVTRYYYNDLKFYFTYSQKSETQFSLPFIGQHFTAFCLPLTFLLTFRVSCREFRALVIEMVLATDMSSHFQLVKTMKSVLALSEFNIDKPKALSLILHGSDISHPSKDFKLHYKWTSLLMEEFFRQASGNIKKGSANCLYSTGAELYSRAFYNVLT